MKERAYADFSSALKRHATELRRPLHGSFELTHRCSLDCAHCYNNLPLADAAARASELSTDEVRRILDELASAGCVYLTLTGGEAMARADFLEIYAHARKLGFIITIFSNGTLISERIADALASQPPFVVEITLYGHSAETYEALTATPRSFDRAHRGIRLLTERGVQVRLKSVGVTHTADDLPEMQSFALKQAGRPLKFDSLINGRIDGSNAPFTTRLSPERIVELDLRDPLRVASWQDFATRFGGPTQQNGTKTQRYHCGGAVTSFAIDPQGKLSLCVLSKREQFDLRTGSFEQGFSQFLRGVRASEATRVTKCTDCSIKVMCGMCPAMGELETGDPDEPVPFLCEVAHLRALVLDISVPAHGDCEYCAGGAKHAALQASAAQVRIQAQSKTRRRTLPIASESTESASGGCGSCSATAAE